MHVLLLLQVASARITYLLALQTSILKQLILHGDDAAEEIGTSQQRPGQVVAGTQVSDKPDSGHSVEHLQSLILSLSSKIFAAATQVCITCVVIIITSIIITILFIIVVIMHIKLIDGIIFRLFVRL